MLAACITGAFLLGFVGFLLLREKMHKPRNFHRHFDGFSPTISTHRGYGKYAAIAENTLGAFLAAEKKGFQAHELDVRRTRDYQIVLLHGPRLQNTTDGTGRVERREFSYLQNLNAAAYVERMHAGQKTRPAKIPTLAEVLANISPTSRVNIEIKRDRWDLSAGLEEGALKAVREAKAENRVFFSGFHFLTLWNLRRMDAGVPVGLLIEPGRLARAKFWLYRLLLLPDNIHLHYSTATPRLMARLKKQGYGLAFWTVNDEAVVKSLFENGADVIITDRIDFITKFPVKKRRK